MKIKRALFSFSKVLSLSLSSAIAFSFSKLFAECLALFATSGNFNSFLFQSGEKERLICLACTFFFLSCFVLFSSGKKSPREKTALCFFDKIPNDLSLFLLALLFVFGLYFSHDNAQNIILSLNDNSPIEITASLAQKILPLSLTLSFLSLMLFSCRLKRAIMTKTLFSNTFLFRFKSA